MGGTKRESTRERDKGGTEEVSNGGGLNEWKEEEKINKGRERAIMGGRDE